MTKDLPDPQMLRNLLRYDPETGFIYRKSDGVRVMKTPHIKGYLRGVISKHQMLTHRVAWLLHNGSWPDGEIDHINGNKHDNRIANLRDVPRHINARNAKMYSHNTSGHTGVRLENSGRWSAKMMVNLKTKTIGYFDTIEEAVDARAQAQVDYGFTERHGQ